MKKILSILLFLSACCVGLSQDFIFFSVSYNEPLNGGNPMPKTPVRPPQATLDGHVLTFTSDHADYTLTLFNEDGDEAYTVFVPYDVDVVMLPATLNGSYGIQLDFGGNYVFVSEIDL
jgi:uncharacterized protein YxeA